MAEGEGGEKSSDWTWIQTHPSQGSQGRKGKTVQSAQSMNSLLRGWWEGGRKGGKDRLEMSQSPGENTHCPLPHSPLSPSFPSPLSSPGSVL